MFQKGMFPEQAAWCFGGLHKSPFLPLSFESLLNVHVAGAWLLTRTFAAAFGNKADIPPRPMSRQLMTQSGHPVIYSGNRAIS
jgi:hypothetical protein